MPDEAETQLLVHPHAGLVAVGYVGHERMASGLPAMVDEVAHEGRSDTMALSLMVHVDRGLQRMALAGRPHVPRMGVAVAHDAILPQSHEIGIAPRDVGHAPGHLCVGHGRSLKGGRGVQDVMVVDFRQPGRVGRRGRSQHEFFHQQSAL